MCQFLSGILNPKFVDPVFEIVVSPALKRSHQMKPLIEKA